LAVEKQRPQQLYVSVTLLLLCLKQTNKTKMMLFECKTMPGGATTVSSSGHRIHCLPPLQLTKSPLVSVVHPQSISCFHAKLFFKGNRFSFVPVRAADSSTTATSQSSSDVPIDSSRTLVPDDEISITKVYTMFLTYYKGMFEFMYWDRYIITCETVWVERGYENISWYICRLFSAYFHKLFRITYENNSCLDQSIHDFL